ncbi:MAG: glycoside hydrolase family 30 protein [Chthoniobacteraceae bacterium]|jgi:glucosylceramidase
MNKNSNRKFWLKVFTLLLTAVAGTLRAADPTLTLTTPAEAWVTTPLPEQPSTAGVQEENERTIRVRPEQTFQTMDGFGGCFNELGWTALQTLPNDAVQQVLKNLFDPGGANFNYCRMPIGADDYALSWYSLDDIADDYSLDHFSVARDEMFLIPYIRAALAYQPAMRLWGSDWSPPIWLKTNGTYHGGSLKMDKSSLTTYAAYLCQYVKEYRKRGINVVTVCVQNEPFSAQVFPSCLLNADQIAKFIGSYLGPRFAAYKPGADIWLGTINGNDFPYVARSLDDPAAAPFIAGAGFQWDGQKIIGQVHGKYPRLPLMQTESECGDGLDDWQAAAHTWRLIRDDIGNGVIRYIYWNMVLDETGSSTWGWRQNALVTVLRREHQVRYNPEFYLMEHLSHFVKLKAVRIGAEGDWPDALEFRNSDGSVIVVAANFSGQEANLRLEYNQKSYRLLLPDSSIATVDFPVGN